MAWARQGAFRRTDNPLLAEEGAEAAVQKLWLQAACRSVPNDARSWLQRVAQNAVTRLAKRPEWAHRVCLAEDSWPQLTDPSATPRKQPRRISRAPAARKLRVERALKKLTAPEERAVRLILLGGVNLHAAASRLKTDRSNLKRILRRAVRKLRNELR
jgi:RNA polymerase sigma factor (sigma-70 family)